MSGWFKIEVTIKDFTGNADDIAMAAQDVWDFGRPSVVDSPLRLYLAGEDQLTYNDLEDRIDDICFHIWKANEAYCEIEIKSLCLDDLPFEPHIRDEAHYKKFMKAKGEDDG